MLIARKQVLPQTGSLLRGGIAAMAQGVTMPFFACVRLYWVRSIASFHEQ